MLQQEKPNKFFFDQEKLKQKKIKQLQTTQNNETTITNNSEILNIVKPSTQHSPLKHRHTQKFKKPF